MRINQIWELQESDPNFSHGLLLRRYSGSILPSVFVALKAPERIRCIAAAISNHISVSLSSYSDLRDIAVELVPDPADPEKQLLLFELLNSRHKDIFAVLCEDLMFSIESVSTEPELVRELFGRFEKWKSLFDTAASQGLTGEEQRGLYGELYLLRKLLQLNSDYFAVIASWVGCEKQIRDFQYHAWSIEVKTTAGNNHQRLHISSERQLDCSQLEHLFLYHLSLEVRQASAETLNDLVDSIRVSLQNDFRAQSRFNAKLADARYFNHHQALYSDTGYEIRHEAFYRVHGDFPRIEEQDTRDGVGDVRYSIIVSQASRYTAQETEVIQTLNFE